MEIKDFIKNFAGQFDDIDAGILSTDTRFRDLPDWSSLVALSVISMIDDEYNVVLKGEGLRGADTIGELFDIVKSKM